MEYYITQANQSQFLFFFLTENTDLTLIHIKAHDVKCQKNLVKLIVCSFPCFDEFLFSLNSNNSSFI